MLKLKLKNSKQEKKIRDITIPIRNEGICMPTIVVDMKLAQISKN